MQPADINLRALAVVKVFDTVSVLGKYAAWLAAGWFCIEGIQAVALERPEALSGIAAIVAAAIGSNPVITLALAICAAACFYECRSRDRAAAKQDEYRKRAVLAEEQRDKYRERAESAEQQLSSIVHGTEVSERRLP